MDTPGNSHPEQAPVNQSLEQIVSAKIEHNQEERQRTAEAPRIEMVSAKPVANAVPPAVSVQPALTADDVAKAIAAVPMPMAPVTPSAPAMAADQDVIEPEWVDAAEKAITDNSNNPYSEEEAVENLQVD